jgi:hypothetical protein
MRKVITIFFFFLLLASCNSRDDRNSSEKTTFEKEFSGKWKVQTTRTVIELKDGGYLLIGDTDSRKAWILKLDKQGRQLWQKIYEGLYYFSGVKETKDFGYIIVGMQQNWDTHLMDALVIKTDSIGNKLWELPQRRGVENYGFEVASSAIELTEGGYLVGGLEFFLRLDQKGNTIWKKLFPDFEGSHLLEAKDNCYIIVINANILKIAQDGNTLWERPLDIIGKQRCLALVELCDDAGIMVTGIAKLADSKQALWFTKLDNNGAKLTEKTLKIDTNYELFCVKPTKDGNYILLGENTKSKERTMLLKIDRQGNKLWEKKFRGTVKELSGKTEETVGRLLQTSDGGYILCGEITQGIGKINAWVVKTDENGNCPEAEK